MYDFVQFSKKDIQRKIYKTKYHQSFLKEQDIKLKVDRNSPRNERHYNCSLSSPCPQTELRPSRDQKVFVRPSDRHMIGSRVIMPYV